MNSLGHDWDSLLDKIERRGIIDYSMVPVNLAASCGVLALGIAMPEWFSFVRIGCIMFGLTFAVSTAALLFIQIGIDLDIHETNVNIVRKKHELPLMKESKPVTLPPAPVVEIVPPPVEVFHQTGMHTAQIKRYDNPPSSEFIQWLFETANGVRRIASERAISEQWEGAWNEWLAALEEQGVIERMWKSELNNAPRRIVEGVTVTDALVVFGYTTLPPAPSQSLSVHTDA